MRILSTYFYSRLNSAIVPSLAVFCLSPSLFAADSVAPVAVPVVAAPAVKSYADAKIVVHEEEILITASRLESGVVGASTSIIDGDDIELAPVNNLQEYLSYQAGIQFRDFFGNSNGSHATVDMRGFGAVGKQNTLFLLNGRRLNDLDLAAVDLSAIPMGHIDKIEIIRGNAGSVLYGDGATGGVINIITKAGGNPDGEGRVKLATGSDAFVSGDVSYAQDFDKMSVTAHAAINQGDGYRENNEFDEKTFYTDMRYWADSYSLYTTLTYRDREIGFPGHRRVNPTVPINEVESDPRGTSTPYDMGEDDAYSITTGYTKYLSEDLELIFDLGYRSKDQYSEYFYSELVPQQVTDATLSTISLTPRVIYSGDIAGKKLKSISGLDIYQDDYTSDRRNSYLTNALNSPVEHRYEADQMTIAAYTQNTVALNDATDVSLGLRAQYFDFSAVDNYNPAGSTIFGGTKTPDENDDDIEYAAHLGVEYGVNDEVTAFSRIGRSFRMPTIDERIGSANGGFKLEPQTSFDIEAGVRSEQESHSFQTSVYWMQTSNEILFDPTVILYGANANRDKTDRYGIEFQGDYKVRDDITLFASASYTVATFADGSYDGNDVPLVAPITFTMTSQWDITSWLHWLTVVNYVGERHMENGESNTQVKMDDYMLLDMTLAASYLNWDFSLSVKNMLDTDYYNYAVGSATTYGIYNVYTQPGANYLASVAYNF
ncbi:MAG: TonB-dependent receptor [Planctomycetes bacterium]|nr:TonB-dependent receptor [Planctomycetota bacterium]